MDYRKVGQLDISLFTLGTVQLGLDYGVVGSTQKPSQEAAFGVLDAAARMGVTTWDTANNYGDSEQVIGNWNAANPEKSPTVITKIGPLDHSSKAALRDDILRQTEKCCQTLKAEKLDMLMIHNFEDFEEDPDVCTNVFRELKDNGIIRTSAISAYSEHDYRVLAESEFDAVQIPLNVFDWEKIENGEMEALRKAGKAVFTRSIYLQGLVFMDPQKVPKHLAFCIPTLEKYQRLCREFCVSPAELALSYVLSVPGVTSVVLGCQTPEQVVDNCNMINNRLELTGTHMELLQKAFADTPRNVLDPRIWC